MRETLYVVYLKSGHQDHWHAGNAQYAAILAMAAAIRDGRDTRIYYVLDTITNERYSVDVQTSVMVKQPEQHGSLAGG